ncbi:signal peptidase II [Candidatus Woesearchaeota archaeon]|nr:signal peptidase II [Candidatus Woesearchaeota archaeon]
MNKRKYLLLTAFIIAIDQIFKYFMPFKVRNYGASFDILKNQNILLVLISLIALLLFLYLFLKTKENKLALSLLIGGTASNLADRILLGYIVDYIPLPYLFTFNIADLANFIGVLILIKTLWKK